MKQISFTELFSEFSQKTENNKNTFPLHEILHFEISKHTKIGSSSLPSEFIICILSDTHIYIHKRSQMNLFELTKGLFFGKIRNATRDIGSANTFYGAFLLKTKANQTVMK